MMIYCVKRTVINRFINAVVREEWGEVFDSPVVRT